MKNFAIKIPQSVTVIFNAYLLDKRNAAYRHTHIVIM